VIRTLSIWKPSNLKLITDSNSENMKSSLDEFEPRPCPLTGYFKNSESPHSSFLKMRVTSCAPELLLALYLSQGSVPWGYFLFCWDKFKSLAYIDFGRRIGSYSTWKQIRDSLVRKMHSYSSSVAVCTSTQNVLKEDTKPAFQLATSC